MRLLQPAEREVSFKKERDFVQRQALELSEEITNIVKSFNRTKTDLEIKKSLLLKDYNEFCSETDEKRRELEEEVRVLESKRDNAFIPLYEKEKQLGKKEHYLTDKEGGLDARELNVKVREKDAKELKSICDALLEKVEKTEKDVESREFALTRRENKFKIFMRGQRELFEKNEQKLREWLERERAKLKK